MSLELVIAEARRVAEADGLDALSMRTLAARLGCTPRALYRYVENKEQVLELVADGAFADLAGPRGDLPWPAAFLEYFTRMRGLLVSSPAVALIIVQRPVAGPHFRRHADQLVLAMTDAGLAPDLAIEAVMALAYYTLGASLPGTGDALLHAYRRLRDRGEAELPVFQRRAPDFTDGAAETHFRSALEHLIRGYVS